MGRASRWRKNRKQSNKVNNWTGMSAATVDKLDTVTKEWGYSQSVSDLIREMQHSAKMRSGEPDLDRGQTYSFALPLIWMDEWGHMVRLDSISMQWPPLNVDGQRFRVEETHRDGERIWFRATGPHPQVNAFSITSFSVNEAGEDVIQSLNYMIEDSESSSSGEVNE